MQINRLKSQSLTNHHPQTRYNHYNVCFSYTNRKKHSQGKQKESSATCRYIKSSLTKDLTLSTQVQLPRKSSFSLRTPDIISQTCRKRQSHKIKSQESIDNLEYIVTSFPQRKQRSGEQQLLKLLMKFTNNLHSQNKHSNYILYDKNQDCINQNRRKIKNLSRFNWLKHRYCANRDKQAGIISEFQGSNRTNVPYEKVQLLRASLQPKKAA